MDGQVIQFTREALWLVLLLSAPPVGAAAIIGLVVAIAQAVTQIQEQTLTYVPKLIAILLTLTILGPWMLAQTIRFTTVLFQSIPLVK